MSLNKSSVLRTIQKYLYKDINAVLFQRYKEIHLSQQRLVDTSMSGFWFKGKMYSTGAKGVMHTLHPALHKFMEDYLTESQTISEESNYVTSYIQSVLNQCTEEAHLYYLLPQGLHSILCDEGISDVEEFPLITHSTVGFYNQKGKELLLARMMLNMTGA